jgi:hypothetical protein
MKTFFSALLTAVLFIIAPITNAALYQGTITGTASIWPGYSAPFNDGDPFTLTLLVDTAGLNDLDPSVNGGFYESVSSGIQLLLNIGGYTGTFENFLLQIQNDDSGTTDSFSIVTPLDVSGNIFNGSLANLGLSFLGPTSVLQDGSLVQSFAFTDFTTESNISFDANFIEYAANLTMTSGSYAAVVPIPAALYLFAPALAGLVTLARRKKK